MNLKNTPRERIADDRIVESFSELENEAARRSQAIERQQEFLLLAKTADEIGHSSAEIRNLRAVAGEGYGDPALRRQSLHRLAERYLDRGDVTLGLQAAEEALAAAPPAEEADEIGLLKGKLLSKAGRGEDAEALYNGLVASASSADVRCRALDELGRAIATRGDIDNGIAKIEQGLALNTIDENPHTRLELHYGRINALGKANRDEQKGLAVKQMRDEFTGRINDFDVDVHFCNVLKFTAARQEALARMEQTIRDNPSAPNADRNLFVLGREYRKDKNTDKVLETYGYYIQTYPGNTFFTTKAYQYMIDALLDEKRLVLAADTMTEVADFVNGTMDFRAQLNLARKFYEHNEEPTAKATFAIGFQNAMNEFDAAAAPEEKMDILLELARYAFGVKERDTVRNIHQMSSQFPYTPGLAFYHLEIAWYAGNNEAEASFGGTAQQILQNAIDQYPDHSLTKKLQDRKALVEELVGSDER